MARTLSVSDYGVLAVLFSIIYILTIFSESIQTIITKYSATEKDEGKLKNILKRSLKKGTSLATALFLIYLGVILVLAPILKINYLLLVINGLAIYSVILLPINRGILQGKSKFKPLGFSIITESFLKLIFSVSLVLIGWKIYGAIMGLILGGVSALVLSFLPLRYLSKVKEHPSNTKGIYNYTGKVFFVTALIVLFYTIDVIIIRILFSGETAGVYAIASILGKIIFWGTVPIGKAMFPLSAESRNANKNKNIFLNALFIMTAIILVSLALFYLIPDKIVQIFSGKKIPEAANILFYLGVAFSLISISNLILLYKLSIDKTKKYYFLSIFFLIEVILFFVFSGSLETFSISFIVSSAIFLLGSIASLRK